MHTASPASELEKSKKCHACHKQGMGWHDKQQADRKRWSSVKQPCSGIGWGYRQLVVWECKMSRAKVRLIPLPLFMSGNTDNLRHGMGTGQTCSADHCCSPSLWELTAEVLAEQEAMGFFTTNIFGGITAVVRKDGKTIVLKDFHGELLP